MRIPYTYLIIHQPTKSYYYGCRFGKNCTPSDLWKTYFTSSKKVHKLIGEYGKDSFAFQIRKTFDCVDKCRDWESRVLKKMKVVQRSDFINKTDNRSFSFEDANKGRTSRVVTEAQRNAVRETGLSNKGRKHSPEVNKRKGVPGHKNGLGRIESPETREKKRLSKLGKPSNAVGNHQPRCSCIVCGSILTSSTIKQHFGFHHINNQRSS